jgi:hypothetical protein
VREVSRGRKDGVRTLEDLKGRCRINEHSGCWVWAGAVTAGKVPCVSVPAGLVGNEKRLICAAYKLGWLLAGKAIKPGQMLARKVCCAEPLCVWHEHRQQGSRSAVNRNAAKRGSYMSQARTETLWAIRKKQALAVETVAELESLLAEGMTASAAAAKVGCDKDTAAKVRDGRHMHQRRTGAASVFTWRPGCA